MTIKTYKVTKVFAGLKVGATFDVEQPKGELSKFVETIISDKKTLVPRHACKEVAVAKTGVAEDESPDPRTSAADDLLRELGLAPDEGKPTKSGKPEAKKEEEEPAPKPKPKKKVKLKKDEFLLSSITGGRLPTSGIDHVMKKIPKGTYTKGELTDVPKVDESYVWNADLLESMWLSWVLNKKMLLSGMPGTGKTTAVAQFCAWIGQPMMRFNGKDGIEASSFLGYPWATKGGMEWKDGMLPQGVRQGYVVTIDECFKIPPGIQMAMQNLYEENGFLTLDDKPGTAEDKMVLPHANFRMYLTDNVKGVGDSFDKFAATQVQDSSTLDRFGITATVLYMGVEDEVAMLEGKYPKMKKGDLQSLVKFAGLVRTGYAQSSISLTLSPRGLQTICEILSLVPDMNRAIQMAYTDKLGEQDEVDAVNEMMRTVWS